VDRKSAANDLRRPTLLPASPERLYARPSGQP
jgi:hypothetical protein